MVLQHLGCTQVIGMVPRFNGKLLLIKASNVRWRPAGINDVYLGPGRTKNQYNWVVNMRKGYLQPLHELLFSLNIALVGITALILGDGVFAPFVRLSSFVNQQLGRKAMDAAGGYLAFFGYVTVLTTALVFILWFLRRAAVTRAILAYTGGFLAIGLSPACWFYITHWHGWYPIEVIVCALCSALYLAQTWPIPTAGTILLMSVHYGFWGHRFWQQTRHNIAELLLPTVGFLSCIVWGLYVRACNQNC
jgi:hypothetical protein